MESLIQRIRTDGKRVSDDVLLVDSFLNHQVDPQLMAEIGAEFARFARALHITRVVTIESSGIAPAQMTALGLAVPLVILKKSASTVLKDGILQTEVFSFTKRTSYQLTLKSQFILPGDRVLLVDDFLANGQAALGAAKLIEGAGGTIAAIGIVIEKSYQPGRGLLEAAGYLVHSLARIAAIHETGIDFLEED